MRPSAAPVAVELGGVVPRIVPWLRPDLDDLMAQLRDPARWVWRGGRWRPRLDRHRCRHDLRADALKVYVDQPTSGPRTRWRLYLRAAPGEGDILRVEVLACRREH